MKIEYEVTVYDEEQDIITRRHGICHEYSPQLILDKMRQRYKACKKIVYRDLTNNFQIEKSFE